MNGIIGFWARNSVAANLLMFLAFVFGFIGYNSMEEEIFPAADFNGVTISMVWQGASPQDTEDQLVERIEEAMVGLQGVKSIDSRAYEGGASVWMETDEGVDMTRFIDDVRSRVDAINNLPQSAFEPRVQRWQSGEQYMGIALYGPVTDLEMSRIADDVRDEIARLPGGDQARVNGVLAEEISIDISEDTLRRYDLTFDEVASRIRQSSLNVSGGRVRTDTGNVALEARNRADNAAELREIIIRQSTDEGTLYLGDIATITDGFVDARVRSTFNGQPTAFILLDQPEVMYVTDYYDALEAYIEEYNARADDGTQLTLLFTQADFFERLRGTIASSALLGMGLVLIILILFLRPTVAFWTTIGIATAFAGTFAILPLIGVSFNLLSMFALLLVIGVVVDDAIVVGENIHRQVEMGERDGVDAAILGTQLVMKPVIFGVLTTIIMFTPWALVPGSARQFTEAITFVVVVALTCSLIECLLILPAHLSHMKPQRFDGPMGGFFKVQRSVADSLLWFARNIYKPAVELAAKYRYITAAVFAVLFWWAFTLAQSGIVKFRFMPEIESDLVFASVEMPDGTPFSRIEDVRTQLTEGIDRAKLQFTEEFPNLEEPIIQNVSIVATESGLQSWISLGQPETRPDGMSTRDIALRLREIVGPIPDAEDVNFNFTFNNSDNAIFFSLNNNDLDVLRDASAMVREQLASYEAAYDITDTMTTPADAIQLELKPGAESLGLTLATVSNQVRQAYFGEEVYRVPRDGQDIRVMMRYPPEDRQSLDSLRDFRVRTATGQAIPLAQIANVEFGPGIDSIRRRDRTRSAGVRAELNGDVRADITKDMEENFWPKFEERFPTVERGLRGGAQDQADFMSALTYLVLGALLLMFCLLSIAFKSYSQAALLMLAIPFAYAGAVFGHLLFGVPMAMFSLFGIGAAAGVVINDNLVLLDYINRRRALGVGAMQAVIDAGVSRFRPVLLTSVTTFVGILPMIAEQSIDAQFLKPMVISLGCAVGFAMFISLLMVPAMYLVGVEVGRFFKWAWAGKPYRHVGETYAGEAYMDDEAIGPSGQRHRKGDTGEHVDPTPAE